MPSKTLLPIAELERVRKARSEFQRELENLWATTRALPEVVSEDVHMHVEEIKSLTSPEKLASKFPLVGIATAGTVGLLIGSTIRNSFRSSLRRAVKSASNSGTSFWDGSVAPKFGSVVGELLLYGLTRALDGYRSKENSTSSHPNDSNLYLNGKPL